MPPPDGVPRPWGMPTVRERVGPQACTRVLEPIVAANCPDPADGFRPQRRAHHAVQHALSRGWGVVEADLQRDVDTIAHALRLRLVARRISERRVLQRSRPWLTAGVGEPGPWPPPEVGSPPGGGISLWLANMYLPGLEMDGVTREAGRGERCR